MRSNKFTVDQIIKIIAGTDITGVSKTGCVAAMSLITPVSLLGAYQFPHSTYFFARLYPAFIASSSVSK